MLTLKELEDIREKISYSFVEASKPSKDSSSERLNEKLTELAYALDEVLYDMRKLKIKELHAYIYEDYKLIDIR
jgi:hypothetical protein